MVNDTFTNNGFIIISETEEDDRFSYKTSDASAATKRPNWRDSIHKSSSTPTPTPTATNTPGGPTATFTPTPTPGSDLIFVDGFESGDLSAWTSSTTDSGDLSVSAAAAMKGSWGMQAVLDDTNTIYVTDDSPNAESRYRARFYFDPNSITMASGDAHFIFKGFSGASTDVFQMEFRYSAGNYEIRVRVLNDVSAWTNSNWFVITDASHYIEVDWRAATSAGANDGYLTLWIDGTQQANLSTVDNDTWRVDRARLGALSGLDAGTSGTYYFDAFESRRSSYIGPMALGPSNILASTLPRFGGGQGGGHFINYIMPKALLQSGSLTFTPADDAHVFNASPSNNYGSATTLQVDDSPIKHFLLKFDVTGINSQTVTNAKLCLYNIDGANAGGDIHHVANDSWDEDTVTWNNAPTADAGVLASLGSVSPNTWYEVNLTSHITGDGTYSLRISDSQGGADYSSKEGANDPKLLVAVGGATPQSCSGTTPTNTPTAGPSPTPTNTPTPGPSPTPTNTFAPTATQSPQGAFNSAAFVYDGDGKRVKSVFNGATTTYFVGNHYEVTGSTIIKYYYAGSQRVAMRTNGTLNFLLGDHLGSTSLTTNSSGQIVSQLRYKAWGEERYASGSTPTDYTYTGQYSYTSDFGLYFYNARWYDSTIGRFNQPDTIVPDPNNSQAWDRYAYSSNNPINNIDPSGHDDIPWWELTKFLVNRAWNNGGLTNDDWKEAANTYIPATHDGSNFAGQVSGVIGPAAGVLEANYVTTADGDFQMYLTGGGGIAIGTGDGLAVGYSQGVVGGSGFANADAFEGDAVQGSVSGNLPVVYGGGFVDAWAGLTDEGNLSRVYGYDIGQTIGVPGAALSLTYQRATPAGEVVESILTKTGLIETSLGQNYLDYVNSVTSHQMTGFELLVCRTANQCGR